MGVLVSVGRSRNCGVFLGEGRGEGDSGGGRGVSWGVGH